MKTLLKKLLLNIHILVFLPAYIALILTMAIFQKENKTAIANQIYKPSAVNKVIHYFTNLPNYTKQ